jgi:hypothetical protein
VTLPPIPGPTEEQIAARHTLEGLRALWAIRDARYARFTKPMDDSMIAGVRAGRAAEIRGIPAVQRQFAWNQLASWQPPLIRSQR